MKHCVGCGRDLPDEAFFCPYCETEQEEPQRAAVPHIWRRKTLIACTALVLLLVVGTALYALLRPKTYDANGPELTYRGYHVLLTFDMRGTPRPAQESRTHMIPSHADYAFPSQLFVYRSNDTMNVREAFMAQVAYIRVTTEPRGGASKMEFDEPEYNPAFADAAQMTSVFYDSTCGTNDIIWTIVMKNGDRLILRQYITVIQQPEKTYYSSDCDMSTMEALRSLLNEIEATEPPETLVSIVLPPITYQGKLTLSERSYYFYGTSDGNAATTFTDTVTVETENPIATEFHSIRFDGSGGTGVFASRGVIAEQCVFSGWDVGFAASDGGWGMIRRCQFIGNGVGLQYMTGDSALRSEDCDECLFEDNDIGVQFVCMPPESAIMRFSRTRFRNNGENVRNESHITVDLSESILE